MQTVLIAGGAGFIGSHLTKSLLSKNYKVICIDNFLTSDRKNIEEFLENANYKFIELDVTKSIESKELSDINFIFHLASPASPNKNSLKSYINYPIETLLANSMGTKNMLDLASNKKSKFLFV